MLDPYILSPVLNSLSFGISEFHLRMRQICRPKLYNYLWMFKNHRFSTISNQVNPPLKQFMLKCLIIVKIETYFSRLCFDNISSSI
jgi:hypothetical protein